MSDSLKYVGNELELFQHAKHWKKYFSKQIMPFIKGNVLEVGAGIGATTLLLNDGSAKQWLMLEPDDEMSDSLKRKVKEFPANCHFQNGTINSVNGTFDTILYIDVLEHIETDKAEVKKAASLLNENGHLIILAPAFQSLYSPFDKAIGHFRRYNRKMLKAIKPGELNCISSRYYDSVGYFASLMNKTFLKQKYPSLKQVKFWDNWMIPLSKISDKIFFHSFGKSVVTVWKKQSAA